MLIYGIRRSIFLNKVALNDKGLPGIFNRVTNRAIMEVNAMRRKSTFLFPLMISMGMIFGSASSADALITGNMKPVYGVDLYGCNTGSNCQADNSTHSFYSQIGALSMLVVLPDLGETI